MVAGTDGPRCVVEGPASQETAERDERLFFETPSDLFEPVLLIELTLGERLVLAKGWETIG